MLIKWILHPELGIHKRKHYDEYVDKDGRIVIVVKPLIDKEVMEVLRSK